MGPMSRDPGQFGGACRGTGTCRERGVGVGVWRHDDTGPCPGQMLEPGCGKNCSGSLGCCGEPQTLHLPWVEGRDAREQPQTHVPEPQVHHPGQMENPGSLGGSYHCQTLASGLARALEREEEQGVEPQFQVSGS